ncbi:hypothetical protein LCI18_003030 [Fusarium solani-melongenae]|uniref:Uncharacterized protein n=1 Tax=Fusarium solani subsp. cucurbitae TaxID=2747967 RepID=A0ACD3YT70_FUSSC|nr:hypothetical protein LCI18_003030 [Fusarium solani-melongenae]
MAWKGADLKQDYTTSLSTEQLKQISDACNAYHASGRSLEVLDKSSFSIPLLADKFEAIRNDLHKGTGLCVLRGIDPSSLSMRELFITFAGLASHVSPQRARQSGRKSIVHMTDLSENGRRVVPAPYRNSALPFHADPGADVVAMFVVETPTQGGEGIFCPVSTIYNKLISTRPDLLCELAKPEWPFDPPEMVFSRGALIRSPFGYRPADIPDLTRSQNAALDALHFAATGSMHRLLYQRGDVVFFNNRRLLHGRDGFRDGESGKRLVLRLWLRDEQLAGVPPAPLNKVWKNTLATHDETRPSVGDDEFWPLEPCSC